MYLIAWPRESSAKFAKQYQKRVTIKHSIENLIDTNFNLSMSYRRDSSIRIENFGSKESLLIGIDKKRQNSLNKNEVSDTNFLQRILDDKNRCRLNSAYGDYHDSQCPIALWVVSNCKQTKEAINRWNYGQKLINLGLKLKGYGKCFDNPLPGAANKWNKEDDFLTQFKFYLDFENGKHCKDYLSEKFWVNSLQYERVPIVSGAHPEDVKALAPNHSFIHVEDFKSPEDLLNYLNYLDRNDTAYMEYHKWRLEPVEESVTNFSRMSRKWCPVCNEITDLKRKNKPERRIKSLAKWWYSSMDDDECLNGELDFLKYYVP